MNKIIIFILIILLNSLSYADDSITSPTELAKWKEWVLENHPEINCPRIGATANNRRCAWPGALNINVKQGGASFTQLWEVYGESWLALPGNQQHWPAKVSIESKPVAVLERNNLPILLVKLGKHRIKGEFNWNDRPQFLQIPTESGLINVSIDSNSLAWPNIDSNGRLWFKRPSDDEEEAKKGDSVKVEVFRRISDGIPITMDTVLRLVVSGKPRELLMGRLLPKDSEPTRFNSGLPARIEQDGQLRIRACCMP